MAMDNSKHYNIGINKSDIVFKYHLISIIQKSTAMPFRRHITQYKCFYCDDIFVNFSKLKVHTAEKHGRIDPKENLLVWKEFSTTSNLMVDIQDLSCRICDTKLSDLKDLKMHFGTSHDEDIPMNVLNNIICFKLSDGDLKCHMCAQEFGYFGNLIHHLKSAEHGTDEAASAYACKICGKTFEYLTGFRRHYSPNCKRCRYCDERFQSSQLRTEHIHEFHYKKFQCDICLQRFMSKQAVGEHIRNVHNKEKNGTCHVCGATFFRKFYLRYHILSHYKVKSFECDVCHKKFVIKQMMQIHRRIHFNEKRYVCEVCGKAFIQCGTLMKHRRRYHTDERNFKCLECHNAFKTKRELKKHCKNVHHQENISSQSV